MNGTLKSYVQPLFFGSKLFCSPLEALYTLLIFILSKELNASILQLTILAAAKPFVSIFAFYLNAILVRNPNHLKSYLIGLNIAGCLPCFLFPFCNNIWYYIASYFIFMTSIRSSYPAWMEILKINLSLDKIASTVSKGSSINYFITIAIPLLLSSWMDKETGIWKILFVIVATLQLLNIVFLFLLNTKTVPISVLTPFSWNSLLIAPWKEGWKLCKENRDFTHYLAMFLLGGVGLAALQPVIPLFFKESLHLSYQQITLAISLCKGVGFVLTSSLWARWLNNSTIYSLNTYINLFSCLFIIFLSASLLNTYWVFIAYFLYGIMHSGCELSLNVSGPYFSKEKESIGYSGLNLALLGIKGSIFPALGQLLFIYSGYPMIFIATFSFCLLSLLYAKYLDIHFKKLNTASLYAS